MEEEHSISHTKLTDMLESKSYMKGAKSSKIIGQYRLGKTIGEGAYCKVKLVTDARTKEKFAMKILQPQEPQNWIEVEREIEILRQINHPNIIRIHDVLWSDSVGEIRPLARHFTEVKIQAVMIYIVVELAQCGELWEYISSNGPLSEEMARKLFRQLVSALEYCHMHLICHRDLKLENILLDRNFDVKITDFGLSNFIHPGHSMHTFCGTLAYAAPEILSQQSYVGFFVDIWSLGIILFAMISGDVPWALDDEDKKAGELENLLSGRFRLPPGITMTAECISLLQIMLQPNPKHRATLAQIRTHPWTNKGFTDPPPRIFENYPQVTDIDDSIIEQISLLGINSNRARKAILSNEPCPALCLYHTLLTKRLCRKKLPPLRRAVEPPREVIIPHTISSAPPSPCKHTYSLPSDELEEAVRLKLSLQHSDDLTFQNINNHSEVMSRPPLRAPTSAPASPTAATPSYYRNSIASSNSYEVVHTQNSITIRRKLSNMSMHLEPIASARPPPPIDIATTTEEKKEKKNDPLFRSLFNKLRNNMKLEPLEA